jgi:hypothetical protein
MLKLKIALLGVLILASCRPESVQKTSAPAVEPTQTRQAEETNVPTEIAPTSTEQPEPSEVIVPTATIAPVSSTEESITGLQVHKLNDPAQIQLAQQTGVLWTRFDGFHWSKIEPVRSDPPVYHWETVDEAGLSLATSSGFKIIGLVLFTPTWAQKYPGFACGPVSEAALGDFVRFLEALVERYSQPPYNAIWEIGNEPILTD